MISNFFAKVWQVSASLSSERLSPRLLKATSFSPIRRNDPPIDHLRRDYFHLLNISSSSDTNLLAMSGYRSLNRTEQEDDRLLGKDKVENADVEISVSPSEQVVDGATVQLQSPSNTCSLIYACALTGSCPKSICRAPPSYQSGGGTV